MRCVVIGLGRMGLRHLRIVREEGLDVVGVADRRRQALAEAESAFSLPAGALFDDPEEMLRRHRPDLAIVATTAPTHCRFTVLAAEAGAQAVLCEKPMAVSLAQCTRMIDVCAQSGTRLAVNHQMRFMEQYVRPKNMLSSAALGGLSSVTVVAGNIGLSMNGTHYFEMFRFMTDEAAVSVAAWFSAEKPVNPRGPEFEDRAGSVRIETASGKRFYMDASADQGHGVIVTYAGRFGRVVVDELAGNVWATSRLQEHRGEPTNRYGMPAAEESFRIAPADAFEPTRAVLRALLGNDNFPDGEVGRQSVETLVAAYLSDERGGGPVDLHRERMPQDRVFAWA